MRKTLPEWLYAIAGLIVLSFPVQVLFTIWSDDLQLNFRILLTSIVLFVLLGFSARNIERKQNL